MPSSLPRSILCRHLPRLGLSTAIAAALALPAAAQVKRANIAPSDIEAATYAGNGDLPPGQSALTARVQILLDRSGVSPGVVDGFRGGMSESAIKAFERMKGLPQDGRMDPQVWALLEQNAGAPLTSTYTVTDKDAEGLVDSIPTDYAEKAEMETLGYTSVAEKIAERFHMDEKFLAQLNTGIKIAPGATLNVTVPAKPIKAKAARILIDKDSGRVAAYDAGGRMVADYPATVGSAATPSPHGSHVVKNVALDPNYTYNPNINFKQGDNDKVLTIPPGPNGPVGNVWIGLSKPTYGIHGTPTPSRLFVNQSNGCVRLTNWDARELAGMVEQGQTVVEFLAHGVAIADVTAPVAPPEGVATANATGAATAVESGPLVSSARPVWRQPGVVTTAATATTPGASAGTTVAGSEATAPSAAALPAEGTAAGVAMTTTTDAAQTPGTTVSETTMSEAEAVAAATAAAGAAPVEADPLASALQSASDGALPVQAPAQSLGQPYALPVPGATPPAPAAAAN